jgi:hypothetical protein
MAGLLAVISILLAASTPATAAPRVENAPNTSSGNVNSASGPPEAPGNGNGIHKFGFQDCGGAKACLGILRMERIRKRSGQSHKTLDQLADDLDKDKDLVSCFLSRRQAAAGQGMHVCACNGILHEPYLPDHHHDDRAPCRVLTWPTAC